MAYILKTLLVLVELISIGSIDDDIDLVPGAARCFSVD